MEFLINDEKKGDNFPEEKILDRHEDKQQVRRSIDECKKEDLSMSIATNSNTYCSCSELALKKDTRL